MIFKNKKIKKRKKDPDSPFDAVTLYLMNDKEFVESIKNHNLDRYKLLINYMKKFYGDCRPDCCLECMAFYWEDKYEDPKPACTLGGKYTEEGQEHRKICDNCVIKELE